jgi:hypothetical protein
MHGSRPDLFQLRQLILAAVVIAVVAVITGFMLCATAEVFSQSSAETHSFTRGAYPPGRMPCVT